MSSLSEDVKLVLKSQGWSEERDISSSLEFVQERKLFPISKKVISNFGHLKVKDQGQHYNECIYFDVDDSLPSKNLRANVYGYEKFGMSGLEEECDWNEFEDIELTKLAEKHIGEKCCRVGFLEEYVGFEIYVIKSGGVYLAHSEIPERVADSFDDFLNSQIKGPFNENT